ncbi:MAG: hypothetical protein QOJ19_247, partial [Acidimicrobiia bacterium]|nr:hypothetical protein [Acidimicrobiia bacterium]
MTSVDLTTGDRRAVAHVSMGRHYAPGLIDYNMLTGIVIDPKGGFWVTSDHDKVVFASPIRRRRAQDAVAEGGGELLGSARPRPSAPSRSAPAAKPAFPAGTLLSEAHLGERLASIRPAGPALSRGNDGSGLFRA